jgi:lipocalin
MLYQEHKRPRQKHRLKKTLEFIFINCEKAAKDGFAYALFPHPNPDIEQRMLKVLRRLGYTVKSLDEQKIEIRWSEFG